MCHQVLNGSALEDKHKDGKWVVADSGQYFVDEVRFQLDTGGWLHREWTAKGVNLIMELKSIVSCYLSRKKYPLSWPFMKCSYVYPLKNPSTSLKIHSHISYSIFYIVGTLSLPVCEQLERWHCLLVAYLCSPLFFRVTLSYQRDHGCVSGLVAWKGWNCWMMAYDHGHWSVVGIEMKVGCLFSSSTFFLVDITHF